MTHIHDYSLCESFRKIKDEISKRVHFVFGFNTSQCQPLSASQNQPLSLSESSHTLRILAYQPPCPPTLSLSELYQPAIKPNSHHANQPSYQPGTITPSAPQTPSLSASTIMPICHHACQPLCMSSIRIPRFKNCSISFSVAKATLQSQMSVCLSVTETPQPLRIAPIDHRAYQLSTIQPIDHQAYQPSSLPTIKPINHQAY